VGGFPEGLQLKTKADFKKHEKTFIKAYNWLLNNPIGTNPDKRAAFNSFIVQWAGGVSYIKIVRENILDTIAIINNLNLLIGNDNGLMHIGYALNKKTLTIFGMTNELEIGGYNKNNIAVFRKMMCRPCFDYLSDKIGCSSFDCLNSLSVKMVIKYIEKALND